MLCCSLEGQWPSRCHTYNLRHIHNNILEQHDIYSATQACMATARDPDTVSASPPWIFLGKSPSGNCSPTLSLVPSPSSTTVCSWSPRHGFEGFRSPPCLRGAGLPCLKKSLQCLLGDRCSYRVSAERHQREVPKETMCSYRVSAGKVIKERSPKI